MSSSSGSTARQGETADVTGANPLSGQAGASPAVPCSSAGSVKDAGKDAPLQSVLDALADAECLRLVTLDLLLAARGSDVEEMFHVLGSCAVARAHLRAGHVHMARQTYIAAAHALHVAVPALRETR